MNATIFDALQRSLALHWAAIEAYAAQAENFARNGYPKLAEAARADASEEREHAARLLARLEFWDQSPSTLHPASTWPRLPDFSGILTHNLGMEQSAADVERAGILACRLAGDEGTAAVLAENLEGSEASIAEITAAQRVIAAIGLDNYLANQA